MLSWMRNSARIPAGRPRGLRGFARAGLVMAWAVFWLNTALFPCCEAAAAVRGGHADSGLQSASAATPQNHAGAANLEPLAYGPDSPCGHTLIPDPPIVGANEVLLAPDRSSLEWFAVDAPIATSFAAAHRAADFTLPRASPPPSLRLYQRTQRLLV